MDPACNRLGPCTLYPAPCTPWAPCTPSNRLGPCTLYPFHAPRGPSPTFALTFSLPFSPPLAALPLFRYVGNAESYVDAGGTRALHGCCTMRLNETINVFRGLGGMPQLH